MAATHHYHVYLKPEPEGGYTVTVPALPGCVSFGETVEEAKTMAQDAIEAYLTSMAKHNEEIVADDEGLLALIDVPAHA